MLDKSIDALNYINKLIDINPYQADAWFYLGTVYSKLKQSVQAIEAFDYCLAIDDTYNFARFSKANELTELEQFKEAIEEYKASLDEKKPDAITLCNIGGCYERLDQDMIAGSYYHQAIKIDPKLAEAWYGFGLTLEKSKHYKEAATYFTKAILLERSNIEYILTLAETLYRLDKPESAIELYQEITDIDPKCMEAWLDWSFILFAQDKFDDAIAVLQTGIEQDPKNHLGHYRMACYLYAAGKTVQSKQFLETALSINPKDFYHIYEILPELQHVNDITALIELYTTNNEKL